MLLTRRFEETVTERFRAGQPVRAQIAPPRERTEGPSRQNAIVIMPSAPIDVT
jgi:hypothetical protein